MTPEKIFDENMRRVIDKLKTLSLYAIDNKVKYQIDYDATVESNNRGEIEGKLLVKLNHLDAIKILNKENGPDEYLTLYEVFHLVIKPEKFERLYVSYKKPEEKVNSTEVQTTKHSSMVKIEGDCFVYGENKISIKRGRKKIVKLLFENARIYRGESQSQKGAELDLELFRVEGGYRNEMAFRDALKNVRADLLREHFPVSIENTADGKYQMVIRYPRPEKL